LASAVPAPRKVPVRDAPAMGPYKEIVRGWLSEDLKVHVKQRHTARRVWQRLVAEHDAMVSEATVRAFVAEVRAELADSLRDVTIPQAHVPGDEGLCGKPHRTSYVEAANMRRPGVCVLAMVRGRAG
jgi:hypothetical protein